MVCNLQPAKTSILIIDQLWFKALATGVIDFFKWDYYLFVGGRINMILFRVSRFQNKNLILLVLFIYCFLNDTNEFDQLI